MNHPHANIADAQSDPVARRDPRLVLIVNELFHDIEGADYAQRHPEIFVDEVPRWRRIADHLFNGQTHVASARRLLDIGSGTGFVGSQLAPRLEASDTFVCADLSSTMLDACRANLTALGTPCRLEFVKLDGQRLPFDDRSFDVVTMNSVLHHVPDIAGFLRDIDRILKPGGSLVIGHEPSNGWASSRLVRASRHVHENGGAKYPVRSFLKHTRLLPLIRRLRQGPAGANQTDSTPSQYRQLLQRLNDRLLAEKLIDRPLTMQQVWQLTDVHDVAEDQTGGFNPDELLRDYLRGWSLSWVDFYNYLSQHLPRGPVASRWEGLLAKMKPRASGTFSAVFRKPGGVS